MSLLDKLTFKRPKSPNVIVSTTASSNESQLAFSREVIAQWMPTSVAKKASTGGKWINWGDGDRYAKFLLGLLDRSSLHNGIVQGKALLTAGGEILVDGKTYEDWAKDAGMEEAVKVKAFIDNSYSDSWERIKSQLAMDWTISGMFALEVIWSLDYTRIVEVNRIPWYQIRPAEKKDGVIEKWFYSDEFSTDTSSVKEYIEIQSFDINSQLAPNVDVTEDHKAMYNDRQILVVTNEAPGYEYFGRPSYTGALVDITTSAILSTWYYNAADGGFQTSVVVSVPTNPKTSDERTTIAKSIFESFTQRGGSKAKIATLFADGKDNLPQITPLSIQNIDAQMIAVSKEVATAIITGHSVTAPDLVGINVPGMLGTGDLGVKFRIFETTVISPARREIENVMNFIASINGIVNKFTFEVIDPTFDPNKSTQE